MTRVDRSTIVACAAGALVLLTSACSQKGEQTVAAASPPLTVAASPATVGRLAREVVLTAEFQPFQEIDVMAKVAGYVKEIHVDIGDGVRQGQLIAVLEIPEMNDELTRAAAAVERRTAEVTRAEEELRRAQSAHQVGHLSYNRLNAVSESRPGLIAQQEIDDAHGRDLVGEAQVAAAKSALAVAKLQVLESKAEQARFKTLYQYTRVTAPFTGVITKRFADTGSMIQAGTASQTQAMPLVRLSQNNLLRLILPVPESMVSRVHVGQSVEVQVPSLHRGFPGKVARFTDRVQTNTRTMPTEVDVPNSELLLIPGMYAEVNLALQERSNALSVPVLALGGTDARRLVYVVTPEGVLEERNVQTGLETADRVEIRSGLRAGELVVIGNRGELKPGARVQAKITEMGPLKGES